MVYNNLNINIASMILVLYIHDKQVAIKHVHTFSELPDWVLDVLL